MQAYSSLSENQRSGDVHSDLGKCCVLEGREGDEGEARLQVRGGGLGLCRGM
jgi:hypothetical protein